jgi:hypothetical protein
MPITLALGTVLEMVRLYLDEGRRIAYHPAVVAPASGLK